MAHIASGPYKAFGADYEKVEKTLITLITLDSGLALLLKDNDKIVGFLLALANETMFSKNSISTEIGLFVAPEYRRTRGFKMLREAYDYWSRKVGCQANVLSDMDNEYSTRLEKVYTREGYKLTERSYLKWL